MDYCDICGREIPEDGRTFPSDRGEVCEKCYRVEDLKIRLSLGELVERLSKRRTKR